MTRRPVHRSFGTGRLQRAAEELERAVSLAPRDAPFTEHLEQARRALGEAPVDPSA